MTHIVELERDRTWFIADHPSNTTYDVTEATRFTQDDADQVAEDMRPKFHAAKAVPA
jgi:hypothetical protein